MSAPKFDLEEISIGDLRTFLAVREYGSFAVAARERKVSASQVSKSIARLEKQLRHKLFSRGARGVTLNESGRQVVAQVERALQMLGELENGTGTSTAALTLAAPSYVMEPLLPRLVAELPSLSFRALSVDPEYLDPALLGSSFDAVLTLNAKKPPAHWARSHAGTLRFALCTTPARAQALGAPPIKAEAISEIPFSGPLAVWNAELRHPDDGCPLPTAQRRLGDEVGLITARLQVAHLRGHLVWCPLVTAAPFLRRKELVQLDAENWSAERPLELLCNVDRVTARTRATIIKTVQQWIASAQE